MGLAFTTIPIGSEAARDGKSPPTNLPTILYAQVAIAALDFGFNINYQASGYVYTPVELTPLQCHAAQDPNGCPGRPIA